MPDPTTQRGLIIPSHGADVDAWDVPLNANSTRIDQLFGAVLAVGTTGGQTDLTVDQCANGVIRVSGTLTSGALLRIPGLSAYFIVENLTTGNFTLQFSTLAGAGQVIAVDRGATVTIYSDGTNCKFVGLPCVGSYLDICDATVPAWVTACTVPPYLNCNGGTFSAITYPYLAAKLGGTTLPDFRGRAPYFLNQGTSRLTSGGAGIDGNTNFAAGGANGVTLAANQIPTITASNNSQSITVSLPGAGKLPYGIIGDLTLFSASATGANVSIYSPANQWGFANSITSNNAISATYTNGSQVIIGSTAPGIVGGIRMIRAA